MPIIKPGLDDDDDPRPPIATTYTPYLRISGVDYSDVPEEPVVITNTSENGTYIKLYISTDSPSVGDTITFSIDNVILDSSISGTHTVNLKVYIGTVYGSAETTISSSTSGTVSVTLPDGGLSVDKVGKYITGNAMVYFDSISSQIPFNIPNPVAAPPEPPVIIEPEEIPAPPVPKTRCQLLNGAIIQQVIANKE